LTVNVPGTSTRQDYRLYRIFAITILEFVEYLTALLISRP